MLGLILLLPNAACAGANGLSDALTKQMQVNRQRYGIAGQALLVAHDGVVLFRGADGYANLDTRQRVAADSVFPVYSLAKLFVSTLVMQLVEQGQLDLDKPASTYLHDLPARWQDITVREFLDHTSGVPEYFDGTRAMSSPGSVAFPASPQAVFASLADKPLLFPPGTDTHYADINYLVLSCLLEAHYREPYPRIVAERIIGKLHLKHTWLGSAALPKRGVVTAYIGRNGKGCGAGVARLQFWTR